MELLAQLDIKSTNNFFSTFFRLPDRYWRGFLASSLSSRQLILFAMWMMVRAPPSIQLKLMQHMLLDPAGKYMLRTYAGTMLLTSDLTCLLQQSAHAFSRQLINKCWQAVSHCFIRAS